MQELPESWPESHCSKNNRAGYEVNLTFWPARFSVCADQLVNEYVPTERILDFSSLDRSDVVVELE